MSLTLGIAASGGELSGLRVQPAQAPAAADR
jgi:hypothetical protein